MAEQLTAGLELLEISNMPINAINEIVDKMDGLNREEKVPVDRRKKKVPERHKDKRIRKTKIEYARGRDREKRKRAYEDISNHSKRDGLPIKRAKKIVRVWAYETVGNYLCDFCPGNRPSNMCPLLHLFATRHAPKKNLCPSCLDFNGSDHITCSKANQCYDCDSMNVILSLQTETKSPECTRNVL
ncbi:Transposase [Caenorhabditis elegans]|uniref:Transposase n=1 Tax=Caenorhabditis elegans TaxID=6239 RepID=C7FZU7_CAEEL|nr:Transposase [Caenorhabditis elegans]CBA11602.1 Transposase [Caenorhabditis elegans]|eukprot:NP_001256796.1 Uncharacterized protein CELE_B0462.5 [Caenorhabditis elegans]